MTNLKENFLAQINLLITRYEANAHKQYLSINFVDYFITASLTAIQRITGDDSLYMDMARKQLEYKDGDLRVYRLYGVIEALKEAIENDFLISAKEIAHSELFDDILDMAGSLLSEGYKDASAVMIGGALETHLRQLCLKHQIPLNTISSGDTKPKRADQLNADLAKNRVYNLLDQKSITAWLDLRNKAAHAHYTDYTKEQVLLMLHSVRNFMTRYPA